MSFLPVVALVGRITLMFALMMLVPLGFSLAFQDGAQTAFAAGLGVTLAAGVGMINRIGNNNIRNCQLIVFSHFFNN